ncbi:rhomboid family intramembrane serine protease [bacterium]|nr:rhomboid family intramembrane serine protease [candidate division CSSED10-310 bacterium]
MIPIRDNVRAERYPIVTVLLIAANSLMFLFEFSLGSHLDGFLTEYALVPMVFVEAIRAGAWFTAGRAMLCSLFLHGGLLHLVGNMWFLWIFGDNVEDRMGRLRYLLFYLLCGAGAALAQVMVHQRSMVPNVGASGAIAGVLAAYMVFYPTARVYTLVFFFFFFDVVAIPALFFLAIWFLFQLVFGLGSLQAVSAQTGGVAWFAHVGGFVCGFILGPLLSFRRRARRRQVYKDEFRPW